MKHEDSLIIETGQNQETIRLLNAIFQSGGCKTWLILQPFGFRLSSEYCSSRASIKLHLHPWVGNIYQTEG